MNIQTGDKTQHPLRQGYGWENLINAEEGGKKTAKKLRRREDDDEEDYEGELDLHDTNED